MIVCKAKKWGNSMGFLIPKAEAVNNGIQEDQEYVLDIALKENPLRELWGSGLKISKKAFLENRKMLESKWM